ncbi:MAG: twin-arginine translocation signal domain-containing protein, partial [Terriglobia bacterium]
MNSKQPNRRKFLKGSAALVGLAATRSVSGQSPASGAYIKGTEELIAYGQRSRFETAVRVSHGGRHSPDPFGLVMHVASPLQDSVGVITPSALHYV